MAEKKVSKPKKMMYGYIKELHGFEPVIGQRVRHLETGKLGIIRKEDPGVSHYVMVLFDGVRHNLPCHPGELEYLNEA